jgi:hypothetical protein
MNEDPALAAATYWAPVLETIADIAFAIVIVALAVELVSGRIAKRFERQIEQANELKIAELNNETARLRKQIAPRQFDGDAFRKSLEGKPKAPVEIMFPREDSEAFRLATEFGNVLKMAGWQTSEPTPIPPGDIPRLSKQPSIASVGADTGVTVVIRADSQSDFQSIRDFQAPTALSALVDAITQNLGSARAAGAGPDVFNVPPPGVLRIVVGPKP